MEICLTFRGPWRKEVKHTGVEVRRGHKSVLPLITSFLDPLVVNRQLVRNRHSLFSVLFLSKCVFFFILQI